MRIRPETLTGDPDALLRQYLRNRILWWNDQIGRLGDNRVRALDAVLRDARDEVADRLARDAAGTARLTDWSRERERELADWLDVALAGTGDLVAGTIRGAATAAIVASADAHNSIFSLDGRASAIATVGVSRAQLDAFMEAVSLGDKVAEGMGAARDEMIAALRVNMVRGGGTAEGVRRAIRAATDAGFSLARRHAITMTRTFTQAANTAAMEAVYRANASIIRRVRRVATLDNGTCLACGIADGAAYDFPGERRPALPAHPRCRCVYVPEAKSWKDFGIDNVRELEEVASPWVIRRDGNIDDGGRRIEKTGKIQGTFQDWWKSLPPELRARTGIGKIRGKLLDSGAVSWDDLWDRSSGRVKSLKELGFGLDGVALAEAQAAVSLKAAKDSVDEKAERFSESYLIAEKGGTNYGFLKENRDRHIDGLHRGIRSFQKQISTHEDKIANPEKYIGELAKNPEKVRQLREKWARDIKRQKDQMNILNDILRQRTEKGGENDI